MESEFLVGYTGFVGSNLELQHKFNGLFNSKNIADAYSKSPNLLVYSGIRSEMFLANNDPTADYLQIKEAIENIKKISPEKLVLISTIAVYPETKNANEDTAIDPQKLSAYGSNRLFLEKWVEKNLSNHLIVRLPAIYGENLKKNFIYDFIHLVPAMLSKEKMAELSEKSEEICNYYVPQNNGFYKLIKLTLDEEKHLRELFYNLGFTAIAFSDSRSKYQFYNLKNLWSHIEFSLSMGIKKLNIVTPPLSTAEVYKYICGKDFVNELAKEPYNYDLHTKYYELFGGVDGYLTTKEQELQDISEFINENRQKYV